MLVMQSCDNSFAGVHRLCSAPLLGESTLTSCHYYYSNAVCDNNTAGKVWRCVDSAYDMKNAVERLSCISTCDVRMHRASRGSSSAMYWLACSPEEASIVLIYYYVCDHCH